MGNGIGNTNWGIYGICIGFIVLNTIISIFISFIYLKTKTFHSYPCYFNLILIGVIAIDNIARLFVGLEEDSIGCFIEASIMVLFDKLMLTVMTIFSVLSFLGIVKLEFYRQNEKCIFISSISTSFLISIILTIIFMLNGAVKYDDICYARSESDDQHEIKLNKEHIDLIVTSVLFMINVICHIYLLIFIFQALRESKKKKNLRKMSFHFYKYLITFIVNSGTFVVVILIILNKIDFGGDEFISLFYVLLSLAIIIFYTINQAVLSEIKKILCCIKEDNSQSNNEDEEDEEERALEIGNVEEGK